jgi:hypothetical protein
MKTSNLSRLDMLRLSVVINLLVVSYALPQPSFRGLGDLPGEMLEYGTTQMRDDVCCYEFIFQGKHN